MYFVRIKSGMCSVYGLLEGSPISPDGFSEEMLQIAQAKGVVLEERKTVSQASRIL